MKLSWKIDWLILPIICLGFFAAAYLFLTGVRDQDPFKLLFDGFLVLLNGWNLKHWFDSRDRRRQIQQESRAMITLFAVEHQGMAKGAFLATDFEGNKGIGCLECGMVSWNPNDVKNRYCASCHKFHKDPRKHEKHK